MFVMPGFMPGIHVFGRKEDVDGRDKPGHDEMEGLTACEGRERGLVAWGGGKDQKGAGPTHHRRRTGSRMITAFRRLYM